MSFLKKRLPVFLCTIADARIFPQFGVWIRALLVFILTISPVGCSSLTRWATEGWVADYDAADQRLRETGNELLIAYMDTRPRLDARLKSILQDSSVHHATQGFVKCRLFRTYEPDRRYVAQYKIDMAPAVILVHRDGTYHALKDPKSAAQVIRFLEESHASGDIPQVNPHIPRHAVYNWYQNLAEAEEAARQKNRPLLIVFHGGLSGDWNALQKLLVRHEVYSRFAPLVHCRVASYNPISDSHDSRFGTLKSPAMVIAHVDGTFDVLEMPTSCEAIVRFADQCLRKNNASISAAKSSELAP